MAVGESESGVWGFRGELLRALAGQRVLQFFFFVGEICADVALVVNACAC